MTNQNISIAISDIADCFAAGRFSEAKDLSHNLVGDQLSDYHVYKFCHAVCLSIWRQEEDANPLIKHKPITVITINLNNLKGLEKTVNSVLNQSNYDQIQYIVLDGGSTDGSLEFLQINAKNIDICIFDKGSGIYPAMNRACEFINSDFSIFMNSGDGFFDRSTCSQIQHLIASSPTKPDGVYGTVVTTNQVQRPVKPLEQIWQGICFSHQSLFLGSRHLQNVPFNTRWKIASDFELIYKLITSGMRFVDSKECITTIETGGISSDFPTRTNERWEIVRKMKPEGVSLEEIDRFYSNLLGKGE